MSARLYEQGELISQAGVSSLASRYARPTVAAGGGRAQLGSAPPALTILVDGQRSFADSRPCRLARTAADAIVLLRQYEFGVIDELWLEHDLRWHRGGSAATAFPVVEELVRAASDGRPYSIGEIRLHARSSSAGAARMKAALRDAGYRVVRHYDLTTFRRGTTLS